jgi:hypothetical protein
MVSISRDLLERIAAELYVRWADGAEVYEELTSVLAEQPAPVSVVLPERNNASLNLNEEQCGYVDGWNACLDEVIRLNQ